MIIGVAAVTHKAVSKIGLQSSTGAVRMHSVLCIASVTTLLVRSRIVREAKSS